MKKTKSIHVIGKLIKIISTAEGKTVELEIDNSAVVKAKFKKRSGIAIKHLGELAHVYLLKEGDSEKGFTYFVSKMVPLWKVEALIRQVSRF